MVSTHLCRISTLPVTLLPMHLIIATILEASFLFKTAFSPRPEGKSADKSFSQSVGLDIPTACAMGTAPTWRVMLSGCPSE